MKEATKRDKRRLSTWLGRAAKALLGLGAVVVAVCLLYYGNSYVRSDNHFQLQAIEYQGANRFDAEAFNRLLLRTFGRNLLVMDLEKVRSLLESGTWVKEATVRRRLPDRLYLYITEREPVAVAAIDNDLYVVDEEGVILAPFGPDYSYLDRPIIKGLKNTARENALSENQRGVRAYLKLLQDFEADGADYSSRISEVDVSDPERVAVISLDDSVPIFLGKNGFARRFERFLSQRALYEKLKQKYGLIEYVDVTYENKIIFHTPQQGGAG